MKRYCLCDDDRTLNVLVEVPYMELVDAGDVLVKHVDGHKDRLLTVTKVGIYYSDTVLDLLLEVCGEPVKADEILRRKKLEWEAE